MNCNCSVTNAVLAVLVIIFTWWNSWQYAEWVVYLAAVLIVIHSFMHKHTWKDKGNMPMKPTGKR